MALTGTAREVAGIKPVSLHTKIVSICDKLSRQNTLLRRSIENIRGPVPEKVGSTSGEIPFQSINEAVNEIEVQIAILEDQMQTLSALLIE